MISISLSSPPIVHDSASFQSLFKAHGPMLGSDTGYQTKTSILTLFLLSQYTLRRSSQDQRSLSDRTEQGVLSQSPGLQTRAKREKCGLRRTRHLRQLIWRRIMEMNLGYMTLYQISRLTASKRRRRKGVLGALDNPLCC